jgi:hypothetical protein
MAAYVELYMDQGADFRNVINLTDDIVNVPINMTGYTVTSQMRRSYYSSNVTATITCTVSDAVNGEVTLYLSANETANIKAGRYLFDVKTVSPAPDALVNRVLEGIITVTPRVTA